MPAKVDLNKRRSMFELRNIESEETSETSQKLNNNNNRRSFDASLELKNRVMSFENISNNKSSTDITDVKRSVVSPPRDSNFKKKLASFTTQEENYQSQSTVKKKTPERDENFYKKLQNFTRMESSENFATSKVKNETKKSTKFQERSTSLANSSPENCNSSKQSPCDTTLLERNDNYNNISKSPNKSFLHTDNISQMMPNENLFTKTFNEKESNIDERIEKVEISRDVQNAPLFSIFDSKVKEFIFDVLSIWIT